MNTHTSRANEDRVVGWLGGRRDDIRASGASSFFHATMIAL
jgi:hypothetical protein